MAKNVLDFSFRHVRTALRKHAYSRWEYFSTSFISYGEYMGSPSI